MKQKILLFLGIIFVFLLAFYLINVSILRTSQPFLYDSVEDVPLAEAAIILGAKVFPDGRMSDMLTDRTLTALELYESGKVQKILASGDHGQTEYDEVNAIKNFLLDKGVKPEDLFMDHAGFDTYDSLYRARDIFGIRSAVVVTQTFHLPRAVYIGRSLDIDVYGMKADRQPYLFAKRNAIREKLASIKAFLNILFHSKPTFLGEPIPIQGDGRLSWD